LSNLVYVPAVVFDLDEYLLSRAVLQKVKYFNVISTELLQGKLTAEEIPGRGLRT